MKVEEGVVARGRQMRKSMCPENFVRFVGWRRFGTCIATRAATHTHTPPILHR